MNRQQLYMLAGIMLASQALAADPASPPPPDKKISITLTVEQWNVVLQAMGSQSYDRVQPLIAEMQAQAAPQVATAPPPEKKEKK